MPDMFPTQITLTEKTQMAIMDFNSTSGSSLLIISGWQALSVKDFADPIFGFAGHRILLTLNNSTIHSKKAGINNT